MKLFKKKPKQLEVGPMPVYTFNPLKRSTAENSIKPRIHASIVTHWDNFNKDLYDQLLIIKNQ